MIIPMYGKIENVPNHQPENVARYAMSASIMGYIPID